MSTVTEASVDSDLTAVCQAVFLRRPVDPEVLKRVIARGEAARAELAKLGTVKMADDLIRETRDECGTS